MKKNIEELLISKEDAHQLSVFYKAQYMDECGEQVIDTIGRFKSIRDLEIYVQEWCYDEIDDYSIYIRISEWKMIDGSPKRVNAYIDEFCCIDDEE